LTVTKLRPGQQTMTLAVVIFMRQAPCVFYGWSGQPGRRVAERSR
jgi:hypothetical protein